MREYIETIQRKMIDDYHFAEDPDRPGVPLGVPDGEYPMTIGGRLDLVRITDGRISCCNFAEASA